MGLFGSLFSKFTRSKASPQELDEFRAALIASDIGPKFTDELIDLVGKKSGDELAQALHAQINSSLSDSSRDISLNAGDLTTILIVGVNGTGKTTSAAKLADRFSQAGKKVILGAADTFRAAAVEQLQTWGERANIPVVSGAEGADPASVAFDAAQRAKSEGKDILIIDTAGRLHTKSNLMDELGKVKRVVEKITPISEVLFVLDGTTGQNGITQAKVFSEAIRLTGIVVTKLDGSTKGGIALATERELQIPIKFVGTGEGIGDLSPFDPQSYIEDLFT
jgi:fused signal recognition particle receptor